MAKIRFVMVLVCMLLAWSTSCVVHASTPSSVVLINAYEKNDIFDTFELVQRGSGVVIDHTTVVTNAHVILDDDDRPDYLYEVCETINIQHEPVCFTTATVRKFNKDEDIAVLALDTTSKTLVPVQFTSQVPALGDTVQTLGYPGYGGETITQTEGKISGFDQGFYKIDANLDSGNSGGGAFKDGKFIGIPTFISVSYATLGYIVPYDMVANVLHSTGNDGTELVTNMHPDAQKFKQFKQKEYDLVSGGVLKSDFITIDGVSQYGFRKKTYGHTMTQGPENIELVDHRGKTMITISVKATETSDKRIQQIEQEDYTYYKETYDTVLMKRVTISGQEWLALYLGGTVDDPAFKALLFFQVGTSHGATSFSIISTDYNTDSFVNGVLLFLRKTSGLQKNYSINDGYEFIESIVPLKTFFPMSEYFIDGFGAPRIGFSFGGNSLYDGNIFVKVSDDDPSFGEITYTDFVSVVSDTYIQIFNESGISVGTGTFVKNEHGSLMHIIPITIATGNSQINASVITFVVKKNRKIYIFSLIVMHHELSMAKKQFLNLMNTIAIPSSHPFAGLGIDAGGVQTPELYLKNTYGRTQ